MTPDDEKKAERLIARLQEDDLQSKLRSGFERDYANSILEQWEQRRRLSPRQLEVLEDLIDRHEHARGTGGFTRRYEGHGR